MIKKNVLIIIIPIIIIIMNSLSSTALINNFTCYLDQEPIMTKKMNVMCEMPDNQTYCCVTNIYFGDNLLATTPEYKDASASFLSLRSEEETRTCFEPSQMLLNAYYTKKNIRAETNFTLEVLCMNENSTTIKSQYQINPTYDNPDWILPRMIWARENISYILVITFFVILAIGLAVTYIIRIKRGRG